MSFPVAPSSKEPLLVQIVQRKEALPVAADLAVAPAGLEILQRCWSVFSSGGESLLQCRTDANKLYFDLLGMGTRSHLNRIGEYFEELIKGS